MPGLFYTFLTDSCIVKAGRGQQLPSYTISNKNLLLLITIHMDGEHWFAQLFNHNRVNRVVKTRKNGIGVIALY